ncbi:reticulophagy regulator 3-like isoform X1 [Amphibalanus amphitrite]|nr:reticulophagy regulator 3-like isoform X1 [Amphibalanus amphitrite]XP_043225351.1 reticulophagy regulator 3-like isoform X1 [Amphibalanus amphitrite]
MSAMLQSVLNWSPFSKRTQTTEPQPTTPPQQDAIAESISSAECALVSLQRIAVWENPAKSLAALIGANIACWAVFAYQLRPVYVIAMAALLRLVRTEWNERIWPEIRVPPKVPEDTEPWTDVSERVLSAPELIQYVKRFRAAVASLVSSLTELRATTPFMFFLVVNCGWTALYVLSRCLSAALLCHLLLSLALTVPGALLHLVPDSAWRRLQQLVSDGRRSVANSGLIQDEDCERDFIPEASPETQAYLDAMADMINGREPSPDRNTVATFSSGLDAAPGYDEESEDDLLAPSAAGHDELDLAAVPATSSATASAAAAAAASAGLQMLTSAAAVMGAASRAAGELATGASGRQAALPQATEDSDSEFELIGDEEAMDATHH